MVTIEYSPLCEREDQGAFLPLPRQERGPELPRRVVNLSRGIDRIVDRAKAERLVSTKGLRAAAPKQGYGRWIRLGVRREGSWANDCFVGARLGLHYGAWSQYRETPLWLYLAEWKATLKMEKIKNRLGDDPLTGTQFVPIHLRTGAELDHVVDSVVDRLRELAHRISGVAPE